MTASSLGALLAERRLDAARLGAVDEPRGVQADRPGADPRALAAREVAVAVVEDLVAVDVGVVVGRRHGQGVVVELAGHEAAHHEAGPGEGLVHRRRLVDPAGERLEVVDRQPVGVQAAVPADHVEGVVGVAVAGEPDRWRTSTSTGSPGSSTTSGAAGACRSRSQ